MSAPARSVLVFGIYLIVSGLTYFSIPNMILPLVGFAPTAEFWFRVVGLLTVILGFYYVYCARQELWPFFRATLFGRALLFVGLTTLVLAGLADPMLIAFGAIDLVGAVWTWFALRAPAPRPATT